MRKSLQPWVKKEILVIGPKAEVMKKSKFDFAKITNFQASEDIVKRGDISENGRVRTS